MKVQYHRSRSFQLIALLSLAAAGLLILKAWHDTMSVPVVKRTSVTMGDLKTGSDPIVIALISDIHVAGPDMPPSRLASIVRQINGLQPDFLMIAGDFISDKRTATRHYKGAEAVAPFKKLDSHIRKIAVLGNHDYWYELDSIKAGLQSAGFQVLANEARKVGPLVIGGLDDDYTGRADVPATIQAMDQMAGANIILSHSPDPFPDLPPDYGLMLAGHTHCGQIRYPWGGSPATMSEYGQRYACGRADENGNTIVTGAGLGTSLLPFRLFSQPEIWLITIRPPKR